MKTNLPENVLCNITIAGWKNAYMWGDARDKGFFMSTDKGLTWTQWEPWNSLLPEVATNQHEFWLDPYEEGVMYVSFRDTNSSQAYLLHSLDKGEHWDIDTLNCSEMAFNSNDHQVEYCKTDQYLFMTKDGGGKWGQVQGIPQTRLFSLALSPNHPSDIYLGSWGGFRSTDGAISWESWGSQGSGLGALKYEFLENPTDPTGLYLVQGYPVTGFPAEEWILLKSKDETGNLEHFAFDYPGFPAFDDYGSIYISKGQELWKLNSAVKNLEKVTTVDSQSEIHFVFHPFMPEIIFGTGDASDFFMSGDFGKSWNKASTEGVGTGRLFFNAGDPTFVYSSSENSTYISQEYGKSWTPCAGVGSSIPNSNTALAVDPRNIGNKTFRVYLAARSDLYVSEDNCKSWTGLKVPFASVNTNSVVIDPNNPDTLYAGTDKGAFVSYDKGVNWNLISEGLPGEGLVYSILVRGDGKVFAATPFGVYMLETK
jgi:hypothetical protein